MIEELFMSALAFLPRGLATVFAPEPFFPYGGVGVD